MLRHGWIGDFDKHLYIFTSVEDDLHWTYFVPKSNTLPQAYLYWSILIFSQCNTRNANILCKQFEMTCFLILSDPDG